MTYARVVFPFAATACAAVTSLACSGAAGTADSSPTPAPAASSPGAASPPASSPPTVTDGQRDLNPVTTSSDEAALVTGNTDFAFALYQKLSGAIAPVNNLFYSPYSVSLALAMTYAGADGETASQMATALSFTLPEAQLNPAFDKLDIAIEAPPKDATGANGTPFALHLADSLWGDEHVKFATPFVDTLGADFGAGLRTEDFLDNPTAGENAINAWVSKETDGDINPLLGPGAITPATQLVLVNAVYFNAAWKAPFDKNATAPGMFTRADGTAVTTPIMSAEEFPGSYAKGDNYEAVDLPYSGGTTSMVVILPNSGAYDAVEAALGGALYETVTRSLATTPLALRMPSFKIHGGSVSLKPALESLGMVDAFDKNADFTSMIPAGHVYVSDVVHQAFVDVDESGTQAAAATAVIVNSDGTVSAGVSVNLDRAFFFFIRDVATNTVLFAGRENDPTAE